MLKPVLGLATAGVVAVLLWKLLTLLLLPLIGVLTGVVLILFKLAIAGIALCGLVWLLRRWEDRSAESS